MATATTYRVEEVQPRHPVPAEVKDLRVFSVDYGRDILGIMHSRKPHLDGDYGVHVSLSKSRFTQCLQVTDDDIETAKTVLTERGCQWPEHFRLAAFEQGPFAGKGVHVWESRGPSAGEVK